MLTKITNKGAARTVDFLGVFAADETKEFTEVEMQQYQSLSGVPLSSSILTDEEQFDIEYVSEGGEG